jgi:hypothetical protein
MGSLHTSRSALWDHEPADWSADLLIGLWSLANVNLPNWSSAFRFMERARANQSRSPAYGFHSMSATVRPAGMKGMTWVV